MKKITFRQVQKAVLAADDAKGTGYDIRANQFSAVFSQMFKFLAKQDVDFDETWDEGEIGYYPPAEVFLVATLEKYRDNERKSRARKSKCPTGKKARR